MADPTERGQAENMALLLQEMLRRMEDQSKRIQDLQEQQRGQDDPRPGPSDNGPEDDDEIRPKRRKRKSGSKVPDKCRDDVRKMYKVLLDGDNGFDGFNLTESVDSPANTRAITTLRTEVVKDYGGDQKCPFSPKELRDAAKRYFRSKRDDGRRREKGRMTVHRTAVRKTQRLVQKAQRRRRALQKAQDSWSEKSKKRAEEIMDKVYMSSESSGEEDQLAEPRFTVRRLAWESKALRKLKDALDQVCPQKGGVARVVSDELSDRKLPEGTPAWAVKRRLQGDRSPNGQLDDSLSEGRE